MKISISYYQRLLCLFFINLAFVLPSFGQPGSNDASFNTIDVGSGGASGSILCMAVQSDGKIVIGGSFTTYNGVARNGIARLNADGSLDATFAPGTGVNGSLQALAIQSDGKIVIGGIFFSYNGTTRANIARVNTDGSLDAGFTPGTGTSSTIYAMSIQTDGKIIIGGTFTTYNGTARNNIARLHTNGSLDTDFNPGTGAGGTGAYIYTTSIQTDGKIIIGGQFTFFNGTARSRVARLNTDGTVDMSFSPGTGANNNLRTSAIQSDGKIIIGGLFTSYNGTARNRICRLNADGSLDAGFNPGSGADNTITISAIQTDGKIIIGGMFTTYNTTAINRLARLNTDGTLDGSFNVGTGANNTIWSGALQSDGKMIIGGLFTTFNGTARTRIARILAAAGGGGSSPAHYFRSIASGNWNVPATWESSPVADFSSGLVSPATLSPDFNASNVSIRAAHTVTVTANMVVDQTTVSTGGNLVVNSGVSLTIQ
ncbi:MAG: hypothetical protein EOP51_21195 [Sphingobacteriales bacterium]|nr:MAG: hypothetical protein EOP51_21195 [Sphingobacteriales bacterium]